MSSDEYHDGKRDAQIDALCSHLRELEARTDARFMQVASELETLKKVCYAIVGAVTVTQLAGPLLEKMWGA